MPQFAELPEVWLVSAPKAGEVFADCRGYVQRCAVPVRAAQIVCRITSAPTRMGRPTANER